MDLQTVMYGKLQKNVGMCEMYGIGRVSDKPLGLLERYKGVKRSVKI